MLHIDTDVLIVYLTNTPPVQGSRARAFFRDLALGTVTAKTTEGVLVAATQVLVSKKGLAFPCAQISEELKRILEFRGYGSTTSSFISVRPIGLPLPIWTRSIAFLSKMRLDRMTPSSVSTETTIVSCPVFA